MQRPIRFMERSNTMTREKRGLDSSDVGEGQQSEPKKQKVPALASVIVEALKVDSLQKLCSSLEPILRRVVSEEVERALAKLAPAMVGDRLSPKQIEGPDGRNLQLRFRSRLSLPLFTGGKVEGEQGAAIHVVLIDTSTGHVVASGPESSVKLDVVVLEGDFNNEDDDDWTQEDFESHVVKEREGKRPLLTGDLHVSLKEGVGSLGELAFTDNSSWIRSRKFRLGVKVASGSCEGIRVREAKTDAFTVKDHRGELYKKHYPPRLDDEVWRLEKIGKDGSFHKRLNEAGIYKVEDFLRLVVRDSQKLRSILGSGMPNKMWDILVEHSKTCVLNGTYYVYYADNTKNTGVIFNNIYELSGLIAGGLYYSAETLSDSQKVFVDTLVKKAYENWMHVVEYDGRMLLNMKQSKRASSFRTEVVIEAPADYHVSLDQQVSLPRLPSSVPSEQTFMNSVVAVGAYKKHDLPTLDDDVWRLKNIAKNGAFHKKLHEVEIFKVRHFLRKLGTEPQQLQKILGSSMSNRMWETLVEHSKTCDLSGKYYVYYADDTKNAGVVFKNVCELSGIIDGGEYYSAENLSDSQKESLDGLKKVAGDNWKDIAEYDGPLPLEMNPSKRARYSQTDVLTAASESCPSGIDQPVSPAFPTVPSGEASENSMPDSEDHTFDSILDDPLIELPSPSPNPSEKADGNTELSVGTHGGSFERGKQPRVVSCEAWWHIL